MGSNRINCPAQLAGDLPDGDCSEAIWEFEPMLVALLTGIKNNTSRTEE